MPRTTARHDAHQIGRVLGWGLGIAASGLAIVLGLMAFIATPAGGSVVLSLLSTWLARQGIVMSASHFSLNPIDLSLRADNLVLRAADTRLPPLAEVGRLESDASLMALIRGRYVLESATVQRLSLHYVIDHDGRTNLPGGERSGGEQSVPDYFIGRLTATDATIRYEDRPRAIDAVLPIQTFSVQGDPLNGRHAVTLESRGGSVRQAGRIVAIDQTILGLDLGRNDLRIEHARVEAERMSLELTGTVADFADPRIDMNANASADVPRIASLAGVQESTAGTVQVNATLHGTPADLEADVRVRGQDLGFQNVTSVQVEGGGRFDAAARTIDVDRLDVAAPWGRVTAREARVALADGTSRATMRAADIDVRELARALKVRAPLATRLDATLQAQWPGVDYQAATGRAELTFSAERRPPIGTVPLAGRLAATLFHGDIAVDVRDVRAAGAQIAGRVALRDRSMLEGDIRAHVSDVRSTTAALSPLAELGPGNGRGRATSPLPVSGPLHATVSVGGTLADPMVVASLNAPALDIQGAGLAQARADLTMAHRRVELRSLEATLGEAQASATGALNLVPEGAVQATVGIRGLPVSTMLTLAGRRPDEGRGTVDLDVRVTGTTSRPQGAVSIRGEHLMAYGESLGTLVADLRGSREELQIDRLELHRATDGESGRLIASGRVSFATGQYEAEAHATDWAIAQASPADGRAVSGRVSVSASGSGTLESPAGRVAIEIGELRVGDRPLGDVNLDGTVSGDVAHVMLRADAFGLSAEGEIGTASPFQGRVSASVHDLDFRALPLETPAPLTGQVTARVDAEGSVGDWRAARVDARVESLEGTWNGQPFTLTSPVHATVADERATLDELTMSAGASNVSLRGTLPLTMAGAEASAATRSASDQVDESTHVAVSAHIDLPSLAAFSPAMQGWDVSGAVELSGEVGGTIRELDPDLILTVDDAMALNRRLGRGVTDLSVRASLRDGVLTVDPFRGAWDTAFLTAMAEVPLPVMAALPLKAPDQPGPATLTATLVGLNPGTLPGSPELVTGNIGAALTLTAPDAALSTIEAALTFSDLSTWLGTFELAQQSTTTVRLSGGTVSIDALDLSGTAGHLQASGTVGLAGPRPLDVRLTGSIGAVVLNALAAGLTADGQIQVDASAGGTLASPDLQGALVVSNVDVAMDEPTLAAEHMKARVDLAGRRVTVSAFEAQVNGGRVQASGGLTLAAGDLEDMDIQVDASDIAFDAPLELRSLSDTRVRLTEHEDALRLEGTVTLKEAGLTGNVNFDTGLLATLNAPPSLDLTQARNPLIDRLLLDVQVKTATPILVDNNIANAEISTDLRLVGTPYDTGLTGTITIAEGGEVTLNERRYEVDRGTITFLEERRIVPSFDLQLRTEASGYEVQLAVTGEPGATQMTLTSDPVLPEPDIMALLVTGRTLDQMRGEEYDVAREQVLSYLVGRVGSSLGSGLERATGLSEVRLEPALIANEADPGARLTIGQDLTDDLRLVYSTDLANANNEIWVARYDLTRRFQTNVVRQSDGSYRFDFRHDVRAGGRRAPERVRRERPTVARVDYDGDDLPGIDPLAVLGLEVGKPFDYFKARDGVQRVERLLQERGYLQSRVRLDHTEQEMQVRAVLHATRGPLVELRYDGARPPRGIDAQVKRQWNRGIFDIQRGHDTAEVLAAWLVGAHHLAGRVSWRAEDVAPERRRVVFTIEPGPRFATLEIAFDGAAGIAPSVLTEVVHEQHLEDQLFRDPFVVTELLRRFYRESGYLVTEIDRPVPEFDGSTARIVFKVREGPRFVVRSAAYAGNQAVSGDSLSRELPLRVGDPFLPSAAEEALNHIRDQYWRRSYNDVRVDYALELDRRAGDVHVTFRIHEGLPAVVTNVRVEGTDRIDPSLVREQLDVAEQEPLDLSSIGRSRRTLYKTGAFSVVDITREPVPTTSTAEDSAHPVAPATPTAEPVKDVVVNVNVREVQPFQIRYGGSFDTERGLGGVADISTRNVFGAMRLVGLSTRYDASVREGRLYVQQPTLRSWPVATTGSLYYRDERNAQTALGAPFNVERFGLSVQQERTLRNRYLWNYGYRFELARRFRPEDLATISRQRVAPLTSTVTRDTRDEILDATTGSFTSHALSLSPSWLGADAPYLKYYGQYFRYLPLQPPQRKRFTNELIRPRFVFASGVRLGLAWGPDGHVPDTERFFAGGSTTLRGFDQNTVGSFSADGLPNGGNGLLVLNNELRFPLISIFDGVAFMDVGGVFDRVSRFGFRDIRQSAGIGVRLRTPWLLLRGDYAVVLDPRTGEPRSRAYISIGQAF